MRKTDRRGEKKPSSKRKKSNFLIKKDIQFRIMLNTLFWVCLSSFVTGIVIFLSVWPLISGFVPYNLLSRLNAQIFTRLLLMGIPMIIVLTVASIISSHRIAGPVYRIEKILDMVNQEKKDALIHLREGDLLHELAQKVNRLIENFRECSVKEEEEKKGGK